MKNEGDEEEACAPTHIFGEASPTPGSSARVRIYQVINRPGYDLVTDARSGTWHPGDPIEDRG